jgi:hypothetical protein
MPHIDLDAPQPAANSASSMEWLKWLLLVIIAIATALIAYRLMPN